MKILIYFICFLVLISTVHSLRQRFDKSRNLSPRGHRHHIFNNVNPAKTSNKRKTTQVTKIVTVSDNGKETVKTFNHHNQKINNGDWSQPNHPSINHHQNHKDQAYLSASASRVAWLTWICPGIPPDSRWFAIVTSMIVNWPSRWLFYLSLHWLFVSQHHPNRETCAAMYYVCDCKNVMVLMKDMKRRRNKRSQYG